MDIDLTEKGRLQAAKAGRLLKAHGFQFDEAHTSVLKRAVRTLWTALHCSNQHWIPVKHTWRLNERHYGALTGLSKDEAAVQLGEDMLLKYRRGYDTEPISMTEDHPCWTGSDRRYANLGALLPRGESLKQCKHRVLPYWYESVVPSVRSGKQVLVAAHNNVIRCLCKHLDDLPVERLRDLEIPTGAPLVYTLDAATLKPVGDPDHLGFRGRFLTEGFLTEDSSHMGAELAAGKHAVRVNEVVGLESLQREALRLGLDMNEMQLVVKTLEQEQSQKPRHGTFVSHSHGLGYNIGGSNPQHLPPAPSAVAPSAAFSASVFASAMPKDSETNDDSGLPQSAATKGDGGALPPTATSGTLLKRPSLNAAAGAADEAASARRSWNIRQHQLVQRMGQLGGGGGESTTAAAAAGVAFADPIDDWIETPARTWGKNRPVHAPNHKDI